MSIPDDRRLQTAFSFHQTGNLKEAAKLYRALIKTNPNNFHAQHYLGVIEATVGNIDQAKLLMARSMSIQPPNIQFIENYATILLQAGDPKSALEVSQQGLQLNNANTSLLYVSAMSLFKLSRLHESITQLDKLLSLQPNHIVALNERASVLAEMEHYDAALACVEKALLLNPRYAEAHLNKGNLYGKLKCYEEAFGSYERALGLKPDLANAWLGRGNVLNELKRYDQALAAYDKALALRPNLAEAWYGRANVFANLKCYDEALGAYDKALALKSNLANAWAGRGYVFNKLKRHEEAANAYAEVLKIDPNHPFTKGKLLHQKMLSCDWRGIEDLIAEIDGDVASGKRSAGPFGHQAIAHCARDFRRCAEIFAADQFPRSQTSLWCGERYGNSKIRVGYLSGEFRNHVTSRLMIELFELHDRNRFELFAFDNGWDDGSELRGRINKAFNTIVDISRLDDLQVATLIKQKQIDILVNLNGYFGEHRTRVFTYKPSPIQVSYLGFSATMGTDYIDYIIADRYIIPPEHRTFYAESVVYLPYTYQVNDTKRQIAMRAQARAELKLPDKGFIFCCFNNSFKITPQIFDVWMRLLNKVNDCVLWLLESNPAVSRNLREVAKHRNISAERLVFSAYTKEYSDYLARYRVADLFLDTLPFNAGGTASDALWVGLPLLTCSGQTYTARMAGSLLNAIGLPELITTTLEAYEQVAIDLATNPEKLLAIKHKLAENRLTAPLFDTKLFTKHIEVAYTMMYERHQAGLAPDHIIVPN
jgi:protein O-GlcNAc transferase